jgi:protein-S-isoprenylcysteine O-methyltransferase Ste14
MSLLPAFELGLWNAWIFTVPLIVLSIFGGKIVGIRESGEESIYTEKEKSIFNIYLVIIVASYTYSVFLPLKLGTLWFYFGLLIFLLGMIIEVMAMSSFVITPIDKPVIEGIYRVSRNPMYIGEILIYVSIGIACVSWIFLLLAIVASIMGYHSIDSEERFCLKKYGNAYQEYLKRTPRWIGIPKSGENDRNELRKG